MFFFYWKRYTISNILDSFISTDLAMQLAMFYAPNAVVEFKLKEKLTTELEWCDI